MKKLLLTISCLALGMSSHAASTTDSMEVRARAVPACFIAVAQDIDFGTLTPGQTDYEADGVISWRCTRFAYVRIVMDGGSTASDVDNRTMQGPNGNQIQYQLYKNAARNDVWGGRIGGGFLGLGTDGRWGIGLGLGLGSQVDYSVYAKIEGVDVDNKDPGLYTDMITVTLDF